MLFNGVHASQVFCDLQSQNSICFFCLEANGGMVPVFQVFTSCSFCSIHDLSLSKFLLDTKADNICDSFLAITRKIIIYTEL
jgi:hypothetical protein